MTVALVELLDSLDERVKTELSCKPDVVDRGHELNVDALPIQARRWHKSTDVVAVFADLKNSSQLGVSMHAASTASVYEAAVGGAVDILDKFGANYLDIQGDAAFGVFWGDMRTERALCAGITIKTFSPAMAEQFESKWPTQPDTGFRVGIAASTILVKRIGVPRHPNKQKPVWAGRAVNYASKAGSACDRHGLVVTGTVWDRIETNDYLTATCDCGTPSDRLWEDITIERLRAGDEADAAGRQLTAPWCRIHGEQFCRAILDGKKRRATVSEALHASILASQSRDEFRASARRERRRWSMSGAAVR
ncbi:hypothetical protein K8O92_30315 [Nocardia asteroides]|uniref:hypothetical protein n=1 Tax=Nocardia TaxID=1817 RepID=UPI001356B5F7|nr:MULTISPECIES: hypothetical protein [Nocardia]UAK31980.1 hypothetical protein K8O92_30315 [Nocardia asteroides]